MVARKKGKVEHGNTSTSTPTHTTTRCSQRILRKRLQCAPRLRLNPYSNKRIAPSSSASARGHDGTKGRRPASSGSTFNAAGSRTGARAIVPKTTQGELNFKEVAAMMTFACSSNSSVSSGSANSSFTEETAEVSRSKNKGIDEGSKVSCIDHFLNLRKEIDAKRTHQSMMPSNPKIPTGYQDFLMNRRSYTLAGAESQNDWALIEPTLHPDTPANLSPQVKEFISGQHKERHKLRMQHLVEREKLVLSMEQEILREHNRPEPNQMLPLSVCGILKDEEVYTPLADKHRREKGIREVSELTNAARLQMALTKLDDKWTQIKKEIICRHRNEASSLQARQKLDLEWKLMELDGSFNPLTNTWYLDIPLVHVTDKF